MKEIAQAIKLVMEEVNGVAKNMTVGNGNSSYKGVSDKDVKQAIRESMIKNGLSILPTGVKSNIKMDRWEEESEWNGKTQIKTKQSVFTDVETKYILLHTSGESIKLAGYGQGVDTQDKGAGKATTYALKNTLLNMFLIPTGVDTDDTHSDDLPVPPKKDYGEQPKKWLNYETFKSIVDSGNTTETEIADIIKQDGYTLSANAKTAVRHYITTGEINKDLFFKK